MKKLNYSKDITVFKFIFLLLLKNSIPKLIKSYSLSEFVLFNNVIEKFYLYFNS